MTHCPDCDGIGLVWTGRWVDPTTERAVCPTCQGRGALLGRWELAVCHAYMRRAWSGSGDYNPNLAAKIYRRFGGLLDAVAT